MSTLTLAQGIAILDFSRKVLAGEVKDPKEVARALVGLALDLVPVDDLAPFLTEAARKRDDALVDAVEAAKVAL